MKNKVVLITGAGSGIGRVTAIRLNEVGYKVISGVRLLKDDKLLPDQIKIDVTSQSEVTEAVNHIRKNYGPIDVLINNAGRGYLGPVEDFSIDDVKNQFEINFYGSLRMIKAVVPMMKNTGKGLIINISSINGLIPFPMFGVYGASKFALEAMSETMAVEVNSFGIKVVLIEPGVFMTNFAENAVRTKITKTSYSGMLKRFFDKYDHIRPARWMARLFDPERVASLIEEIIEDDSPRLRYPIGIDAQIYLALRRVLPEFVWLGLMKKVFKNG